jgi:hypothetical protein
MNHLELAYLQGQADYEATLLAQQQAEQEQVVLAYHAAAAEAVQTQLLQQQMLEQQMLEQQMLEQHMLAAAEAESAELQRFAETPSAERDAMIREEAYQLGVALAQSRQFVEELNALSEALSGDAREAFDQGVNAVTTALAAAQPQQQSKRDRPQTKEPSKSKS